MSATTDFFITRLTTRTAVDFRPIWCLTGATERPNAAALDLMSLLMFCPTIILYFHHYAVHTSRHVPENPGWWLASDHEAQGKPDTPR